MIFRLLRLLRSTLVLLFALGTVYVTAALILGYAPVNGDFYPTPDGTEIFVCSNGVHTDFVLPLKTPERDWSAKFPAADFSSPVEGFDHVGIGWGDLDFYRSTPYWRDVKIGTALRAFAGLGPAALHVQYRSRPTPLERCEGLTVDRLQYRALIEYIDASLSPSPITQRLRVIPAGAGYGATDTFYLAEGHFSAVKSCNVWVGEGLKAAGLPTGVWTPFDFLILAHLK